jgi:hypothetical protein
VRLYSIAVTSLAVDAPVKWTDNLLSQHEIPNVRGRARGVARGVTWPALVQIALVRELHIRLGCGVREAVTLAADLLAAPEGTFAVGDRLTIGFERDGFERRLHARLADALESAPRPRRGRPPRRERRSTS